MSGKAHRVVQESKTPIAETFTGRLSHNLKPEREEQGDMINRCRKSEKRKNNLNTSAETTAL